MAGFKNFSIWRGRLPHWRADGVVYYLTFNHRRDFTSYECGLVYQRLVKCSKIDVSIICVLPSVTELMFTVRTEGDFTDSVEKAKAKAGREIIKKSGERFSPVGNESYDRIVRDQAEFEERWAAIFESCSEIEGDDDYDWFWCSSEGSEAFGLTSSESPSA